MAMLAQEAPSRSSILPPLALSRLLQWLDNGVDSQGERYLEMHRRLVSYFDRHGQSAAERLADETLGRIALTLAQTGGAGPLQPARYCYTVARAVLFEGGESSTHDVRHDVGARPARRDGQYESLTGGDDFGDALDRCLRELPQEERVLIVEYYRDAGRQRDHRIRLAEGTGVSEAALGHGASSIRHRLMGRAVCREGRR